MRPDKDLWNLLTDLSADDLVKKLDKIEEIIYRSCEVKRKVVVDDELDNGVRLYLNFGHTIGHAVENTAGYGKVMHGEAVAEEVSARTGIPIKCTAIREDLAEAYPGKQPLLPIRLYMRPAWLDEVL